MCLQLQLIILLKKVSIVFFVNRQAVCIWGEACILDPAFISTHYFPFVAHWYFSLFVKE